MYILLFDLQIFSQKLPLCKNSSIVIYSQQFASKNVLTKCWSKAIWKIRSTAIFLTLRDVDFKK